jgi:alpha-ribazole phosphatase
MTGGGKVEICLIRHPRPDVADGICYGRLDLNLAPGWQAIADNLQTTLAARKFDSVFCSPLRRCRILADQLFAEYKTSDLLVEMNFGSWEGVSWDTVFNDEDGRRWFDDYLNYACPEGESFKDVCRRVDEFVKMLIRDKYECVAVVSHAGVMRAFQVVCGYMSEQKVFEYPIEFGKLICINAVQE